MRTLKISLAGLTVTAAAQLAVVLLSGSVALLADTAHNFGDALTAVPVGIALLVGRRPASRRYTHGYGRAEDLAVLAVLAVMTASAVFAAYEAVVRVVHPQPVHDLGWVAAAGLIGRVGLSQVRPRFALTRESPAYICLSGLVRAHVGRPGTRQRASQLRNGIPRPVAYPVPSEQ